MNIADYQGLIRRIVCNIGRASLSEDDVNDIVQEVNLRILDENRRPDYDPSRGEVRYWIGVMAKTMTIDALRRQTRRLPYNAALTEDVEESIHSDDVLTMLLRRERMSTLETAIKQLPPDDQHFLLISMRDDYDNEAYAARLGMKPVALRVRKVRLAEKLRSILAASRD